MEFINVGTGELLFLVLLAILVVGPKRTIQLARQVGQLLTRLQREWRRVQRDLMAEVNTLEGQIMSEIQDSPASTEEPQEGEDE
jgi:Sec-independent protein translocase protein TatA